VLAALIAATVAATGAALAGGCSDLGWTSVQPDETSVNLELNRDIYIDTESGERIQVTAMEGAEDCEALSPSGKWMAFVGARTGIASVYVARVPDRPGDPVNEPVQLTNVGLEDVQRQPGKPPEGWVAAPTTGGITWTGDQEIAWDANGRRHTVDLREAMVER
jgi:hypothetical protein